MQVGETKSTLSYRLHNHISKAKRNERLGRTLSPCQRWILRLLEMGRRPGIKLLATTTRQHWKATERLFIRLWRKKNPGLLNVLNGGDGPDTKEVKVFCDKCGTRRRRVPSGHSYCPQCYQQWSRRSPKCQAYRRAYKRSPKGRVARRAYNRVYNRSPKRRTYWRERYHARKLGITVAEYRART